MPALQTPAKALANKQDLLYLLKISKEGPGSLTSSGSPFHRAGAVMPDRPPDSCLIAIVGAQGCMEEDYPSNNILHLR